MIGGGGGIKIDKSAKKERLCDGANAISAAYHQRAVVEGGGGGSVSPVPAVM